MSVGTIKLVVVKGSGLMNRDTFGKSDPYVIVFDPQGKKIHQTSTVDDNLSPEWPVQKATTPEWPVTMTDGSFCFQVFDEDVGEDEFMGECYLPVATILKQRTGTDTMKLLERKGESDSDVKKKKGDLGLLTVAWTFTPAPPPAVPQPAPQPVASQSSYGSPGGFAQPAPQPVASQSSYGAPGGYAQPAPQPVASQSSYGAPGGYAQPAPQPVALQPSSGAYGQPPISAGFYQPTPPSSIPSSAKVTFTVVGGRDLLNVDGFMSGDSDPYAILYGPSSEIIVKTHHIDNTLKPSWNVTKDWSYTAAPPPGAVFKVCVWDDETTGDDQFMGEATVKVGDVLSKPSGSLELKLVPRTGETDKKITKANGNLGFVTISWTVTLAPPAASRQGGSSQPALTPQQSMALSSGQLPADARLKIFVRKANGLLNRDAFTAGVSDPFVVVKDPSGAELIHTQPLNDTLDPEFDVAEATREWPIPAGGAAAVKGYFHFAVWDYDPVGGNDFLGEAILNVQDLIRTQSGENAIPLKPRPNEPDKEVSDNASKLGTLTVAWDVVLPSNQLGKSVSLSSAIAAPNRQPPIKFPGNLAITVVRCQNLLNLEMFGTSDPYVIAFGLDGKELHRTPHVDGNLNPTFPAAKSQYLVRINSDSGALTFHVMDKETTRDRFMGLGSIDVAAVLAGRDGREIEVPLRKRENEPDKPIATAAALGTLFIKATFEHVTEELRREAADARGMRMPVKQLAHIQRQVLPGTLTMIVKGAVNLHNKEITSTSDPYCIVKGPAGDELLRTPAVDKSLNPEWPTDKSKIVLRLTEGFFQKGLAFTVMDKNVMRDELMGTGSLPVQFVLEHENGDVAVPLGNGGDLGHVIVSFTYAPDMAAAAVQRVNVQLPGTVVLVVSKANGLMNQETFGTSDPYAIVIGPDNKEALRTPEVSGTLNPTWPTDKSKALIRVNDKQGKFVIQVWDKNPTSDDFMGEASIEAQDLLSRAPGDITLPLAARSSDSQKLRSASLGTVTFSYSFLPGGVTTNQLGQSVRTKQPLISGKGRMVLKVLNCRDLLALDFSSSDPYVAVVVGGQRVYKTTHKNSNLNPEWTGSDATCDFFVKDPTQPVHLEVYDYDVGSSDDFGGKVQIIPAQLELTGEATMPFLDETLRADKKRGTITFQWVFQPETLSTSTAGIAGKASQLITKPGRVTVTVEACHSLISRATISDTPSVTALYRGEEVFKTAAAKGLNPTWRSADATFSQFVTNLNQPIELHVADDGKFQGLVELIPAQMAIQGRGTLTLQPRAQEPDKEVQKQQNNLGTITLTWVYEEVKERRDVISKSGSLKFRVVSATGLISQDVFGDMEVYAEVHANNKVVLTTKELDYSIKKGSCEWMPGDGTTEVDIVDPARPIVVMLWDKDATSSDFLGQGIFVPNEQPLSGDLEMVLRARPNEQDSNVAKASSLGNLRVSWIFSESKERIDVRTAAPAPPQTQQLPYQPNTVYQQDSYIQQADQWQSPLSQVAPAVSGIRIRLRLSEVRGMRFDGQYREDPELVVALLYNAQELRTNPAVSDSKDPTRFPLNGTFTISVKPGDQLQFRVLDAEELWGREPLGAAVIQWENALAASTYAAPGAQPAQSIFAAQISDARGNPRGEVVYTVAAEPRTVSTGELKYRVREAKDLVGVPSGANVVLRTVCGSITQHSKPAAAITRNVFLPGGDYIVPSARETELITVELIDIQTGAVYGGASVSVGAGKRGNGNMVATLVNPQTKQPSGAVFVEWEYAAAARRPLSEYITPPDGTSLGVVEVLQVKGFAQDEIGRTMAVQLEVAQQCLARSEGVVIQTAAAGFGHIFYSPVDVQQMSSPQRGSAGFDRSAPPIVRLVDETTGYSMGDGLVTMGGSEVEGWITMNGGKQVLVRSMIVTGQPIAGIKDNNLLVRVKRVEPGNSLSSQREYLLSVEVNGERQHAQRTAAFKPQGYQVLDKNFFFPSHLFPRTMKRFPIEVSLFDTSDLHSRVSMAQSFLSRLRRGGELSLDMHDTTRVTLSYMWADLSGPSIAAGDSPCVKTVTVVEANLRNNVSKTYDALFVQLSAGGTPCRTQPSATPSRREVRFGDQSFNIIEGSVALPIRVTLFGLLGGREEVVGQTDITTEDLTAGRRLLPIRARSDEVASVLVETNVTLSNGSDEKDKTVSIRRRGVGGRAGSESYPVRVQFAVGRPFGTRMESHEALEVLRPYLFRHFSVVEEDQVLTWNNKPVDWTKTVAANKLREGDDGIVTLILSSNDKRMLYLQVKTPTGKTVVIAASPQSSVGQVKGQLVERDDTDLNGQPINGIRLMCNYTELLDDEALGFYRLQTGQTLVAALKPRTSKTGKAASLPPKGSGKPEPLRVQDPYGEETIVSAALTEPVNQLRGVLSDEDNVRCDLFINGQRIINEEATLQDVGAGRTSIIEFVFKKFKLGSPDKSSASRYGDALNSSESRRHNGPARFGTFDLEGIDGTIARTEVNMDDAVATIRRIITSDPGAVICYNGRHIINENRTFRDIEAVSGGHFQLRYPGHNGSMLSNSHADAMRDREVTLQRQRATENLQLAVVDLQRQLDAAKNSQNAEKFLAIRVMNLEREVEDWHSRYQNATDRIRELEDTIERQHNLLRRATETSGTSASYANPTFAPHISSLRGAGTPLPLRPMSNSGSFIDSSSNMVNGSAGYQRARW